STIIYSYAIVQQQTKSTHLPYTTLFRYIKKLVNQTLIDLIEMKNHYINYLDTLTSKNKDKILEMENYVDENEKKVDKTIREIISLQSLDKQEIKWLFTINRIIRVIDRNEDQ